MSTQRIALVSIAVALSLTVLAHAEGEKPLTCSLDLTGASHYLDRGGDLLDGAKLPVQPSLTVTHSSGFSAGVWGSWALLDRDVTKESDELNFTLDYSRGLTEVISVSGGGVVYYTPNAAAGASAQTLELYAVLSAGVPLNPSLTVYYDTKLIDESGAKGDSYYVCLGLGHTIPLPNDMGLDLRAALGYQKDNNFDAALTASTSVPLGPVSLSPFAGFTYADTDLNADNYEVFGGVSCSWEF